MAYWIVYQGDSWKRARRGGYLWAPKVAKNGRTPAHWETMKGVLPGDLIFSGVDNALRAVAEVTLPAYTSDRPDPLDDRLWTGDGWRIDVTYSDFPRPMYYRDWVPQEINELPALHSPFHSGGMPNQGYLYELPISVGEYVVGLARTQGTDLATQAHEAAPVQPGTETTRQQLTAARIGQGKFRDDLFERWGGKCAILGISWPDLLKASHIKPWASSNNAERLDPANGLLLSAMYDVAFDALLLSFSDDGTLILASDFPASEAEAAGINPAAKIEILEAKTAGYLAQHRSLMAARSARDGH